MRRTVVRTVLGIALLLHGLGNAVLQLRGVVSAPGHADWAWAATCTLAIVGFVSAGLGLLGVGPLKRLVLPAVIVGGAAALAGVVALRAADLWPGVVLSGVLPLAVWLTQSRHVTPVPAPTWRNHLGTAVGLAFLGWISASAVLWPWHRSWGTTPQDWSAPLPGDRVPRHPEHEILHAVTVDAPPDAVWRWLVQLGQDRAGFYSYESLERLFGVDIHNIREVRPEWQTRHAGDTIYATQHGYLGGVFGERPGWTVDLVEPNRTLVLRYWGAFILQPVDAGRTRFLIRSTISQPQIPAWAAALNFSAFELPHFIMQRRMMLGIKELAERAAR
jgi:hypothetical protein